MTDSILFVSRPELVTPVFAFLKESGVDALIVSNLQNALASIAQRKPLFVFVQQALPGLKVESLLEHRQEDNFPEIVVFSEQGTAQDASAFMEAGAYDYWICPLTSEKMEVLLASARSRQHSAHPKTAPVEPASAPSNNKDSIVGNHPVMQRVLALAKQVAPSRATVLISGESGTGKEMFARFIHNNSSRKDKKFIAVNCAALPEHLLESELFGHEKGAFTGAIARKLGRFELADKGTLLLDEITEMALPLQAKLLRVLQEGEIDRVGGTETVSVDVRVIATTNRAIEKSVEQGDFREDLYYRLNVIPLRLPSLRERQNDILALANFFAANFCREYGLAPVSFSKAAQEWLLGYDWPGNVRELQNLMERSVLLAGTATVDISHFLLEGSDWSPEIVPEASVPETGTPGTPKTVSPQAAPSPAAEESALSGELLTLQEMEKRMIIKSLDKTEGNRTMASQLLGISVRTLRNKLNEYKKEGLVIP